MTEKQSAPRSRSRRRADIQRLYAARDIEPVQDRQQESAPADWAGYTPNEDEPFRRPAQESYTPNEETPAQDWTGYQPNEAEAEMAPSEPQEDFSAYYRPGGAEETEPLSGPSFAPATGSNLYAYASAMRPEETADMGDQEGNVYHPREASWAQEDWEEPEEGPAYQVRADAVPAKKRRRKRKMRRALVVVLIVALLAAALLLWQPLTELLGDEPQTTAGPLATPVPTAEPVSAYKASQGGQISSAARNAISQLSGTLDMEPVIVTSANIVTRSSGANSLYDFYLFTAEGRLLCYFEGLEADGVSPQSDGSFYVAQSPWLVAPDGSDLIRVSQLESHLGGELELFPVQHGWAMARNQANGSLNYINTDVQLLSPLWFSRAYPFTGAYTAAYADTGSDSDQRYLLYVLGEDGAMNRWMSAPNMEDLIGSACGMAYLNDGSLYALPDTQAPAAYTDQADAYPDCGAVVVRDPATGLYGLFVDGRRLYDCMYDSISPVESDLSWAGVSMGAGEKSMSIHAVTGVYPQPLAYSFALKKDDMVEYVSLSAQSDCPVRLDVGY